MGDSLQLQSVMSLPAGGAHTSGIRSMEVANELFAQIHGPIFFAGFQSDRLADKSPANEPQASLPFDMSAVAHAPLFPSRRILQRWQCQGINPAARTIKRRRRASLQRFVRTLSVVLRQPAIRTSLCLRTRKATGGDHFPL